MAGVEGERREHRRDLAAEVLGQMAGIAGVWSRVSRKRIPAAASPGLSASVQQRPARRASSIARASHQLDLLLRRQAVHGHAVALGAELLVQSRHANHEELVEVGADDREELDALEQRMPGFHAWARTRSLNASQLSSRLMNSVGESSGTVDGAAAASLGVTAGIEWDMAPLLENGRATAM